jgi:D-alanyl-D-alanine carboxypeptidase (penicillin-binding protein 5/6)
MHPSRRRSTAPARVPAALLAVAVAASCLPTVAAETGRNGADRDAWLPLTAAADAPLPADPVLDTDDCRYDSRLPRAFDADAARGPDTPEVRTVARPGPGGPGMDTCGTVAADGMQLPSRLSLGSYVVYDVDTGDVLAAKDPYGLYRPASIIKILLVMVALDTLDLDAQVPVTPEMVDIDGSRVGIGPGGHYTARQLLQGLVMASGNDAALALAEALGGKDATVTKMQSLADSLGVSATKVTTVNGLDTPDVQTTAWDMALLYRAAFRRDDVRRLLGTQLIDFPGFDDHPGFQLSSDNGMLYNYPGALGGKTGFTDNARHTYAAAAQRDGRTVGIVALNSTIAAGRPWEQAEGVFDAAFGTPRGAGVGQLTDPAAAPAGAPADRVAAAAGSADTAGSGGTGQTVVTAAVVATLVLILGGVAVLAVRRRR